MSLSITSVKENLCSVFVNNLIRHISYIVECISVPGVLMDRIINVPCTHIMLSHSRSYCLSVSGCPNCDLGFNTMYYW